MRITIHVVSFPSLLISLFLDQTFPMAALSVLDFLSFDPKELTVVVFFTKGVFIDPLMFFNIGEGPKANGTRLAAEVVLIVVVLFVVVLLDVLGVCFVVLLGFGLFVVLHVSAEVRVVW